jgi:hypothetical protein
MVRVFLPILFLVLLVPQLAFALNHIVLHHPICAFLIKLVKWDIPKGAIPVRTSVDRVDKDLLNASILNAGTEYAVIEAYDNNGSVVASRKSRKSQGGFGMIKTEFLEDIVDLIKSIAMDVEISKKISLIRYRHTHPIRGTYDTIGSADPTTYKATHFSRPDRETDFLIRRWISLYSLLRHVDYESPKVETSMDPRCKCRSFLCKWDFPGSQSWQPEDRFSHHRWLPQLPRLHYNST